MMQPKVFNVDIESLYLNLEEFQLKLQSLFKVFEFVDDVDSMSEGLAEIIKDTANKVS